MDITEARVAIIGLGYVGLPLAVEFGKHYPTLGFDIDTGRVEELRRGHDRTEEVDQEELATARHLELTTDADRLADYNTFVVTVPTPIDAYKRPDLRPLESASRSIAPRLRPGDVVVYESTVYPGATEEICVPILEAGSGLTFNKDFFVGYSPERINPGDKQHRLPTIVKVVAGSTEASGAYLAALYGSIIVAGIHLASSIKVAEAAKVIENTQRDVNIALINELSLIFERLGIDTSEVLAAAGTKWNFLRFSPGLVGGHCIGVDPYYLTHKAQAVGYHPEMILAGRRLNDNMGMHVASRVIKLMHQKGIAVPGARALVLGLTFKENCPDLRNTRVVDIIAELEEHRVQVDVCDPRVDAAEVDREYGLPLIETPERGVYDAIILAVSHREFLELPASEIRAWGREAHVLFDVKAVLPREASDGRL